MTVHTYLVKEFPSSPVIRRVPLPASAMEGGDLSIRRRRALKRVDRELEKGNYKAALDFVKQLKAHPAGLLRGFGAAAPKVSIQDFGKIMDNESYSNSIYEDHQKCMQHEAGHFLVGYLLGVLPRRFRIPSLDDLLQDKFAGGKVEFIGFEFLRDVDEAKMSNKISSRRKLSNETLRKFSCVILGGLAAEHLIFGYSELLHSDVQKLDRVYKWLGLMDAEVNSKTRQAAETVVLILYHHSEVLSRLAETMALGRSVGACILTIETALSR